ncbi:hypothetical protein AMECASPLE_033609 [Ameca splendens]|uniref:Uncharacterized protein n=1 Tax=Ameca splendens TaxID=208324 RepID=A0ABV0YUG0_9TELE
MEFKCKFNLEDSPPLSPLQPIKVKSSSFSSQSSFNLCFKRPSFMEPPNLQPSLDTPPPHLFQAPLPPQASTPPPVGSQGKTSLILILRCSSKLTSFSAFRSSSRVRTPKK